MNKPLFAWKFMSLLLPIFLVACGGGGGDSSNSSGSGTNTLPQSSATTLAEQISNGAASAFGGTQFSELGKSDIPINLDRSQWILPDEDTASRGEQLSHPLQSIQCNLSSCTVNQPVSSRSNCTTGGNMQVTGSISGTIDNHATGILQIQSTETITDWSCVTGYVFQSDPSISIAGEFSFVNGSPATTQTMTLSGGFRWTTTGNPSVTGTCQLNLTANYQLNGHGTLSGTICGYSVNNNF